MNLERIKLPENVEKKARNVIDGVSENFKKLEEKAQPKLNDFQKKMLDLKNLRGLREKINVAGYKDKLVSETSNAREKAASWFEEGYVNVLDFLGLATKDEVETLRKKLTTLQRKVQKLNKDLQN